MTLISYTSNYGIPVLMGDLLITTHERGDTTQIPGFHNNVVDMLPLEQRNYPQALRQKIYIIKENIALGLAGNVYQMRLFLQDIKSYFRHYAANLENARSFMENYDQETISDCAVIVLVVDNSDGVWYTNILAHGNWEQYDDHLVERGLITGTGSRSFFEKLGIVDVGGENHRGYNINLISIFMAEERYTMDSIIEAWGAGFEVIEYSENGFKKLDDFTYIICHSEFDSENITLKNTPFLVMHYTYHEDILTINTYLENEFKRYGVLPLDIKKEDFDTSTIPPHNGFESSQVVCAFVIEKPEGGHYFSSVLTHSQSDQYTIKASFQPPAPAYLQIHIDDMISKKIAEEYSNILNAEQNKTTNS